jgi:hypothetical protein
MDRWDVFIILAAAYVAIMVLVRLMATRRNQVIEQLREQAEAGRKKRKKTDDSAAKKDRGAA